MPTMSADEKKYRAEDDARTLTRAREILKDGARLKAAKAHVLDQQKAVNETAEALANA